MGRPPRHRYPRHIFDVFDQDTRLHHQHPPLHSALEVVDCVNEPLVQLEAELWALRAPATAPGPFPSWKTCSGRSEAFSAPPWADGKLRLNLVLCHRELLAPTDEGLQPNHLLQLTIAYYSSLYCYTPRSLWV